MLRIYYLAAMVDFGVLKWQNPMWRLAALLHIDQQSSRALGRRTAFVARECRQRGLSERPRWGTSRS